MLDKVRDVGVWLKDHALAFIVAVAGLVAMLWALLSRKRAERAHQERERKLALDVVETLQAEIQRGHDDAQEVIDLLEVEKETIRNEDAEALAKRIKQLRDSGRI